MSRATRRLSVLVATLRYPPYVGGGYELQTRDTVEGLRARGHRVTVLTGRGAELEGQADLLPWLRPAIDTGEDLFERSYRATNAERFRLHFLDPANLRATRRALRASGADVLLFFNLGLVSLAPVLAARLHGVPTLGYLADAWPCNHWVEAWRQAEAAREAKSVRLGWLEHAWRSFRGTLGLGPMLTCSDHLRARLVADGLAPESLQTLYPPLPPDVQVGPPPRARAPGEPLRVVCASSLWEGKGQAVLVEAVAAARAAGAAVELSLLGGGRADYRAHLEGLVRAHGLEAVVTLAGFVPRERVTSELARAHVMAVPSLWDEPFGLVTIEGMAHGLAVLSSDAGAARELVRDGSDGRITPRGDVPALARALCELAGDDGARLALARAGQADVAERFPVRRYYDAFEAQLLRVARGSAP